MIEKVMMVDDDAAIRRIAEIALRSIGKWQALLVESGATALQKFAEFKPDVVLLDVMMPGIDGLATLKKLRDEGLDPSVPVIFMTGSVQQDEVQTYYSLGAAGVISKPFDPIKLPRQIEQIANARLANCAG